MHMRPSSNASRTLAIESTKTIENVHVLSWGKLSYECHLNIGCEYPFSTAESTFGAPSHSGPERLLTDVRDFLLREPSATA